MWPSARAFHSMTYDAAHQEIVMYGGLDTNGQPLLDTWVWNGTTWLQRTTTMSPPGPLGPALGYDWDAGVVVMFGGSPTSRQTWLWDGTDWLEATVGIERPTARGSSTFAWNPARHALVMTQAIFASAFETWEWRTTSIHPPAGEWSRVSTTDAPTSRAAGGSFTTLDGSGITLFQGITNDSSTGAAVDEVWELRYDGPGAADACTVERDADGDGLTGCDDPDCWRRCSPDCPPGTSCMGTDSRCGDGVCGIVENCRICPADCPTCTDTRCGDFVCDPGEANCLADCP
jgi:hypothetical protein